MQNTQKMVRIDPSDAPDFVRRVLDSIINTIQDSSSQYYATPGVKHFHAINGIVKDTVTQYDCDFMVRYEAPSVRGKREQLYVSYGNFEFTLLDNADAHKFIDGADACIRSRFVYDLNSKTYVLRPRELTFFEDVKQWVKSKMKTKTK